MTNPTPAPTPSQFSAFQAMFDHFNATLFEGSLSHVILNFSRRAKCYGFFAPERWSSGEEVRHEISLNPATLLGRTAEEVAGTLVHEMAHAWDQDHGKPGRRGYHGKTWARKMDEVGLTPSTTGAPGGKRTGQRVTHYVTPEGVFVHAFASLPESARLPWTCVPEPTGKAKKARNKIKFSCPGCSANAWGKPGLALRCEDCDLRFECLDPSDEDPDAGEGGES